MSQKSFNRLLYDTCATQQATNQSTGALPYTFYKGAHVHCGSCECNELDTNQDYASRVVKETEMQNRTQVASKCSNTKYLPSCDKDGCSKVEIQPTPPNLCNRSIITEKFPPPARPSNPGFVTATKQNEYVNKSICN